MIRKISKELYNKKIENIGFGELKVGDTVIFRCGGYFDSESWYDGQIVWRDKDKVSVCFLMGYKSENETLGSEDVFFKVDKNADYFNPEEINYRGHFVLVK